MSIKKKEKIGMIVHPFFNYTVANSELNLYRVLSMKYDRLYAYLPLMNNLTRRTMFALFIERGGLYYLLKMNESRPLAGVSFILDSVNTDIRNDESVRRRVVKSILRCFSNYIKPKNELTRRTMLLPTGPSARDAMLFASSEFVTDELLKQLFYSDFNKCEIRKNYIDKLTMLDNVIPLYYGATNTVDILGGLEGFPDIKDIDEIDNIDLFGTYYNVCVTDIANTLKTLGVKTRKLKKWSMYSTKSKDVADRYRYDYLAVYNKDTEELLHKNLTYNVSKGYTGYNPIPLFDC